jgi:hypothetical protein
MTYFLAAVRRALRRAFRLPAALFPIGRLSLAFGIVASMVASAFGPLTSVGVAQQTTPTTRLQVVVKEVVIHDDREGRFSGEGEMKFNASIWICNEPAYPRCEIDNGHVLHGSMIASIYDDFSAKTGETVTLERVLPGDGPVMPGGYVSEKIGFPVFSGPHYVLMFSMVESDGGWSNSEHMGRWYQRMDSGELGFGVGTHTERSRRADDVTNGDFTITYEVRIAQIPDLRASNIRVLDLPGSPKKRVCMGVQNVGGADAGPFDASLYVDQSMPPGGTAQVSGMSAQNGGEHCVEAEMPTSGRHTLRAIVDQYHRVDEWDEENNAFESVYEVPQPEASSPAGPVAKASPEPVASASSSSRGQTTLPAAGSAQADLVVSAIRVNGQVLDGKDDCKDGRNDVAVVVRNVGTADAEKLNLRLVVDDAQGDAVEKAVNGLEAGQEREVKFDDVRLKKGERTLTATADAKGAVAESNEENNDRKVTARCGEAA